MISPFQAQTDVEMFEKLRGLLRGNPEMAAGLAAQGIDVEKKRRDFHNGLYVLAVQAYLKGDYEATLAFLARLEQEIGESAEPFLRIAAGNLQALGFWGRGMRKQAEDSFRKTFYQHRKHPLQRYVLRNLGLFMLHRQDKESAREMFRLALKLKPTYSLLRREYEGLK